MSKKQKKVKSSVEEPEKRKRFGSVFLAITTVISFIAGAIVDPVRDRYLPALLDKIDEKLGGDVLVVARQWPYNDCSPVPMAPAGKAAPPSTFSYGSPDTSSILDTGVGYPYREGSIELVLSSRTKDIVAVTDINANVHLAKPQRPSWALTDASGGCGDIPIRMFELNLDKSVKPGPRDLKDLGVLNDSEGKPAPEVKNNPLGKTFTVSQEDPAEVTIDVSACDQYFEFDIAITYLVNGASHTTLVHPDTGDYKIVGGEAEQYYISSLSEAGPGLPPPLSKADPDDFKACG
ncbi:hypothetical protein [Kribbella sp. NPDC000426]|uniref:hypothetical protein n=1 Tax=Kribbella sp. NPDC000426 TaxID=3154255 RepID=UPI003329E556